MGIINIGLAPNDGNGEPLRSAFEKINNNFQETEQAINDPVRSGLIQLAGIINPATITGNVDDYEPTGISTANVMRVTSSSNRTITGIVGEPNQLLLIANVGTRDIILKRNSANSLPSNRFDIDRDITIEDRETLFIWKDAISDRWRAITWY